MLKLNSNIFNIDNQFENPLTCALLIALLVVVIIIFTVSDTTTLQIVFISTFLFTYGLLYIHYKQLKNRFYKEIMDTKSNDVLTESLFPATSTS